MKALEYLKKEREIKKHCADVAWGYYDKGIDEAIEELEELKNRNSKLSKLNQMTDKALDKALKYLDENKNDKQNKNEKE